MKKTSYPRQDIRVLLLEGVSQTAVDTFRDAGYTSIDLHAKSLPEEEVRRRIAAAHVSDIRSRTQLPAELLAPARRLLAVPSIDRQRLAYGMRMAVRGDWG